ncbi:MAG: hypothetical protein WC637_01300 [Victivallales bacterium]
MSGVGMPGTPTVWSALPMTAKQTLGVPRVGTVRLTVRGAFGESILPLGHQ